MIYLFGTICINFLCLISGGFLMLDLYLLNLVYISILGVTCIFEHLKFKGYNTILFLHFLHFGLREHGTVVALLSWHQGCKLIIMRVPMSLGVTHQFEVPELPVLSLNRPLLDHKHSTFFFNTLRHEFNFLLFFWRHLILPRLCV